MIVVTDWIQMVVSTVVISEFVLVALLAFQFYRLQRSRFRLAESRQGLGFVSGVANLAVWEWVVDDGGDSSISRCRWICGLGADGDRRRPEFCNAGHGKKCPMLEEALRQARADSPGFQAEFVRGQSERGVRWISSRGRAHFDRLGKLVRLTGTCKDVTETRLDVRGGGAEATQPLGDGAALEGDWMSAVENIWADRPASGDVRELMDDMAAGDLRTPEAIRRMRQLLNRHQLDLKPFPVADVVRDAVATVRGDAAARGVICEIEVAPNLLPVVMDRMHMQKVFVGLILNAMDAMEGMPMGARRVLVSVIWRDKLCLEVAISDSGPGFPQDGVSRLFEPFFTTKPDRIGLGLSICRTIVEAHGGRIRAANRPGGGATFRILLPVAQSDSCSP